MPEERGRGGAAVPPELRAEFEGIAARAGAAGHPLRPVPVLEVALDPGYGSRVLPAGSGGAGSVRVRLGADLLNAAPEERAWTIAHELAHALRAQEATRPRGPGRFLTTAAVLGVGSVAAVAGAGWAALTGPGARAGPLLAAAAAGVLGLWLVGVTLIRREEAAADAVAAVVFAEVLTPAGVARLRAREGAWARYVPTLVREHPHPHARRRAGLTAADGARRPGDGGPPAEHDPSLGA